MDLKSIETLEYRKILGILADYCSFQVSRDLALGLTPETGIEEVNLKLDATVEAADLLDIKSDFSIGGARDIRDSIEIAKRGGVLDPNHILDIKYTLIASRTIKRTFDRFDDRFPILKRLIDQISEPFGVIDTITQALSERGEILDSASVKLASIRHDLRIVHDRLISKLQRMVNDANIAPYLQEAIITQREGRYVLPLRADFKGKIKSIVHDQSSSGATLFIEPIGIVDQNNEFRELQLNERDEEYRILSDLSQLIADNAYQIIFGLDILAQIDFYLACAKYGEEIDGIRPKIHSIKKMNQNHPGTLIRLFGARHPLIDSQVIVPIDVILDSDTFVIVITGPNTGGKTVSLKTVGLLILMAQSGLLIPAESGSEISIFSNIFADIGDEQSIEQSLSTFSSHITNIIRILDSTDQTTLVILDELGAGTDPQEGAALARAILDHLVERKITTLVTTHHPELKDYAHKKPGVVNASVEFDIETLRPTYHLTIGMPGRSNALSIAQKLGLPESIVKGAKSDLRPEVIQSEDLLNEIHRLRNLAKHERDATRIIHEEADLLKAELIKKLNSIEEERSKILENARLEGINLVQDLQEEIQYIKRDLKKARQPLEMISEVEEQAAEIEFVVEEPLEREPPVFITDYQKKLELGDKVQLRTLGTMGTIISLTSEEVEVQVGNMRVRTRLSDIEQITSEKNEITADSALQTNVKMDHKIQTSQDRADLKSAPSPGFEIDLRGKRAEDAIRILEQYLEKAYLSGLPFVRVIHGKGTGRLRSAVRELLQSHPYVKSYEPGQGNEGGEGVTFAHLIED